VRSDRPLPELDLGSVGSRLRRWPAVGSLREGDAMDVQFITSVAVITPNPAVSRRLYLDALGLSLTAEADGYLHSEDIDGSKSFGVWPLAQAAQACFGTPDWPADRPVPQVSIEFEVTDVDAVQIAADNLKEKGFALLHQARTEPWGTDCRSASVARGRDHRPLVRAVDAFVTTRSGGGRQRQPPLRLRTRGRALVEGRAGRIERAGAGRSRILGVTRRAASRTGAAQRGLRPVRRSHSKWG